MRNHRIFFDCEFQGIWVPDAKLLSVGLIDQVGREFYAEVKLTPQLIDGCDSWVRTNVFPHLQGGEFAMVFDEIGRRLYAWLRRLAPDSKLLLTTDSPDYDWPYLQALLNVPGYPENMVPHAYDIDMPSEAAWVRYRDVLDEFAKRHGHRSHHALDDAKANCAAWFAGHREAARPHDK